SNRIAVGSCQEFAIGSEGGRPDRLFVYGKTDRAAGVHVPDANHAGIARPAAGSQLLAVRGKGNVPHLEEGRIRSVRTAGEEEILLVARPSVEKFQFRHTLLRLRISQE